MSWNIGAIEVFIEITKDGRMQLGIDNLENELDKLFPIDMRKQNLISEREFRRYEREVFAKREEWIRDNIPPGKYSVAINLNSDTLKLSKK